MMVELGLFFMSWTTFIECKMEPFVVGGNKADLKQFPHSVFMYVSCFEDYSPFSINWVCGGSIVNDLIILTAAHCIFGCSQRSVFTVSLGHVHKERGIEGTIRAYYIHPKYMNHATAFDIALTRFKNPLKFSKDIKRIAVMKNPPYFGKAQIAGWGLIDVSKYILSTLLNESYHYIFYSWLYTQ